MIVLYINHETDMLGGCSYSLENMMKSLNAQYSKIVLFRKKGVVYDYFVKSGYECYVIPFKLNILKNNRGGLKYHVRKVYDSVFNAIAKFRIASLVRGKKVDIIHSNTSVMTIGVEVAHYLQLPHVWHFREFQNLDFGMEPFCGMKKFRTYIQMSTVVIAISDAIYKHWNLQTHQHAYVLRNAVRSKKELYVSGKKDKIILFCSSKLTKSKGADVALDIFIKSGLYQKGYSLVYIGHVFDMDLVNELKRKACESMVMENVVFEGYQSDVASYMKRSSAFLMCSRNEALGRVTIEAMFYGSLVIARNSGGTTEFIQSGENGFLWDDVDEAASFLKRIEDPSIAQIIASASETASLCFSEEEYGKKIMSIYESLGARV